MRWTAFEDDGWLNEVGEKKRTTEVAHSARCGRGWHVGKEEGD